jgi:hypothetical protein
VQDEGRRGQDCDEDGHRVPAGGCVGDGAEQRAAASPEVRARHVRGAHPPLDPLTRDELADQLTDILGAPPTADLLERLWTRSGGNPLFGEELLAAGSTDAARHPTRCATR